MKQLSVLIALLIVAALTPSLHARSWPKSKPQPKPAIHTTITSISGNSITVQESKATKTFAITSDTEIDYDGQPVALSSLKSGMRVSVSTGLNENVASRISASEAPPAPKTPAKAAGTK